MNVVLSDSNDLKSKSIRTGLIKPSSLALAKQRRFDIIETYLEYGGDPDDVPNSFLWWKIQNLEKLINTGIR